MKNQIAQAKVYVKEHAPELITAASVVTLVVLTRTAQKDALELRRDAIHMVGEMNRLGEPFTYYPGLGVCTTPIKKS